MDTVPSYSVNLYPYIHVLLRLFRKVSLCSGQWLHKKLTTGPSAEYTGLWSAQPQIGHLYHTSLEGSRTIGGGEGRRTVSHRDQGGWEKKWILCTHALTASMVAAKCLSSQHSPEEVLTKLNSWLRSIGRWWLLREEESVFFKHDPWLVNISLKGGYTLRRMARRREKMKKKQEEGEEETAVRIVPFCT